MKRTGVIFDHILDFLLYLSCVLIAIGFVVEAAAILMRFFLNISIGWSIEINEYAIVNTAFLASAWVLRKGGHVTLDTVVGIFSTRRQALINAATSVLGAVICGIIFWYGIVTTLEYFERGILMVEKSLRLPVAPFFTVIPLGFGLLFVQFLRRTYHYWHVWQGTETRPEKTIEEATEL